MNARRLLGAVLLVGCGTRTPLRVRDAGDSPEQAAPPDVLDVAVDEVAAPDVPGDEAAVPGVPDAPPDAACVSGTFALSSRPAEIVFVVDRSGSFRNTWQFVVDAFAGATAAIDGATPTGLLLYPERLCDVAPGLHVPVGAGNGARIVASLRASVPDGRTPTRLAVRAASRALRERASGRAGYLVLVTDGVPTCPERGDGGDRDLAGSVAAVAGSAAAGVPVFVIGVGAGAGDEMTTSLDQLAVAGGRPTMGAEGRRYYTVEASALLSVLRTVQSSVARCELAISTLAEGATVRVEFRGEQVREDATARDGWWWSDERRRAITIHGPACERLVREPGELLARLTCPGG